MKRILIAEDDEEDRFMMSQTFDELGYQPAITFAEDGILLLQCLEQQDPGHIGLIVLDLNMPRLNGTETLRKLKDDKRYRHIPVIIFSTSVNEIERRTCLQLGASEYITKPGRYLEYLDTCRRFYEQSQS
jgi:CheY-like chemotaxis protein